MTKKFSHIFFDLDRTLWDFDKNSREALTDIFHNFQLTAFQSPDEFILSYHKHNERLWAQYREGNLTKEILRSKRFSLTLEEKKIKNNELAARIGEVYLNMSMQKTILFPGTHETLKYLKSKYKLYIITNGFKETQMSKLRNCQLEEYFDKIFTSEAIGINKPRPEIFHWAVSSVNARKKSSLMIGDDPAVDIQGASRYGIGTVFFNPERISTEIKADYEIFKLSELKNIL